MLTKGFGKILQKESKNKVLLASLQRCGTQSTTRFLEHLVGPSVQFSPRAKTAHFINKNLKHFSHHLDSYSKEFEVFSNAPYFSLYEDLTSKYPDIKVVLITRREEDWLKSFKALIKKLGIDSLSMLALARYVPDIREKYNSNNLSDEDLIFIFKEHNSSVKSFFQDSANFLHAELEDRGIGEKIQSFLGTDKNIAFPRIDNAGLYK